MTEINLTQQEADALLTMLKVPEVGDPAPFPGPGQDLEIRLLSKDTRESFLLNLRRNRFELGRATYQTRARVVVVLARLDLHRAPHRNPDGIEVSGTHLHVYRHGFGDRWALEIPNEAFPDPGDVWHSFHDFLKFCNITEDLPINRGLF